MTPIQCVPAFGRDYKSKTAVKADWLEGKDFLIQDMSCGWNGAYLSCRDNVPVRIRYKKLQQTTVFTPSEGGWKQN